MATFRDLLAAAKAEITEIDPAGAAERIAAGAAVLDVREPDEYDQGALPDAVHIPRGHLEAQVEGRLLDKTTPVVVYCAGGVRSAFAARTLHELGYADVVSMAGGFGRWKDEGRPWTTPVRAQPRAAQPLPTSPAAARGRRRRAGQAARLEGAAARRRRARFARRARTSPRPASARSASSTWTRWTRSTCSARSCTTSTASVTARSTRRRRRSTLLNPDVDVVTYDTRLDASNIIEIIAGYDVIVDGADNFPSRYLLNDASVKLGIPVVHGSIFRFEGMVSVFDPMQGPTYRDMVPEPPPAELAPSCAEAGVLGVLPGIVGSIQALETIKVLLGLGEPLIGRILSVDTTDMSFRTFNLRKRPAQRGHLRQPRSDPDQGPRRPLRPRPRRTDARTGGAAADRARS